MKLIKPSPIQDIPVVELPAGKVAVITRLDHNTKYIGTIVQRVGDMITMIGQNDRWSNVHALPADFRVLVLPEGSVLEV